MNFYSLEEYQTSFPRAPEAPADRKRRDALENKILARWSHVSDNRARWLANYVVHAVSTVKIEFPHGGKCDRQQLDKIASALRTISMAWSNLSPSARRTLLDELVEATEDYEGELRGPPGAPVALADLLSAARSAAKRAGGSLLKKEIRGQTNWSAVAAVGAVRSVWKHAERQDAPKYVNDSPAGESASFSAFLQECLDALEIGTDPRSAMNAWRNWEGYM